MSEAQDLGWAILELMGHRKLAGYITEHGPLYRIDVYLEDPERLVGDEIIRQGEPIATQLYAPAAIYCITPTTVQNCISVARRHRPQPVARWELPAPDHDGDEDEISDAELAATPDDEIPY